MKIKTERKKIEGKVEFCGKLQKKKIKKYFDKGNKKKSREVSKVKDECD